MRELLVIGIGAGDPDQVTIQAVRALNRAQVIFLIDKGAQKSGLIDVRAEICRRHIADQAGYRFVEVAEPPRDRAAAAYERAVDDWHARRAERIESALLAELPQDGVGALMVWGDPALYDSTLRVIGKIRDRGNVELAIDVIPGVTSIQALTSAHRIPLNRIGEPFAVTTGRRVAVGLPEGFDTALVMLDAGFAAEGLVDSDGDIEVFWGAYLSTPDQVLIQGRLRDVAARIARTKAELRERHGWIMDTYLLRRPRDAG